MGDMYRNESLCLPLHVTDPNLNQKVIFMYLVNYVSKYLCVYIIYIYVSTYDIVEFIRVVKKKLVFYFIKNQCNNPRIHFNNKHLITYYTIVVIMNGSRVGSTWVSILWFSGFRNVSINV